MMTFRKEGALYYGSMGVLSLGLFVWGHWSWIFSFLLFIFCLNFFRDPERHAPDNHEDMIVSPADGKIIINRPASDQEIAAFQSHKGANKLAIFMNVFNVHVNRAPITGKIVHFKHHKGQKLPAYHEKASELNEHMDFHIEGRHGRVPFRLIAGLVAQRIVPFKALGDIVSTSERIGMIKFGSRVDLVLADDWEILVSHGDKVYAGETVIARKK